MNNSVPSSAFVRFSDVVRGLRAALGGWGVRGLLGAALLLVVYRRLGEISRKMEGLAARFQAGRLWRRGARVVVGAAEVAGPRARAERIWPRAFGWLVRAAAYEAAGFGSQLRAVLEQPEMVALLTASPQAGRVLVPLCRMLAIETSLLRPGVVAVAVAAEVVPEVAKRVRRSRVPVDWGRIPLSREIILAARRDGFLKGR